MTTAPFARHAMAAFEARHRTRRWMYDPAGFAHDVIDYGGSGLAPYQEEALTELVNRKRVAVRGPHGLGKSGTLSTAVLWFALTRELAGVDWKVITTASAWRHLEVYLWPEIHKWARHIRWDQLGRRPLDARRELMDLRLKLGHGAATAVASNDPAKIEGAHAESLLYILDEAKIIPNDTWDSIEGAFSGAGEHTTAEAFALTASTPGPPAGRFYDISSRKAGYEDWWTRHVTLDEAVRAGRIAHDWAEQRRKQWGEDSAMYQNRVLGNFHASDEDSVVPLSWIEQANERWHANQPTVDTPVLVSADVGRGGDSTILAHRTGDRIEKLDESHAPDTMRTVALIQGTGKRAIIDTIGIGAGVYDRLKEGKHDVLAYNGAGKTPIRDASKQYGYANVRSAAYWRLRELLDPSNEPTLALPPDDELTSDLTAPSYDYQTGVPPKIKVEDKTKVVDRLGRSPDKGDAVVMAMWADTMRASSTPARPEGTLPTSSMSPLG